MRQGMADIQRHGECQSRRYQTAEQHTEKAQHHTLQRRFLIANLEQAYTSTREFGNYLVIHSAQTCDVWTDIAAHLEPRPLCLLQGIFIWRAFQGGKVQASHADV